jgi:hypothetical protein
MSERCPTCGSPVRVVSSDSERVATCHYQPVANMCQTCKRWRGNWEDFAGRAGVCDKFNFPNDNGGLFLHSVGMGDSDDVLVYTIPTFGCNEWESKADAFGVPQPTDRPRDYLAALEADQD